jgi:hypothetical protein
VSGYLVSASPLQPIVRGQRSYESTTLTSAGGFGLVDASGVRMFRWPGESQLWNHPVGQAQYALHNLNSYRLSKDPRYLAIAEKNAQRLIDRRVESADAWYYPYDFDFAVHGDTTQTLVAPWYSAMAQGQALSAFTRLFEVTQDPAWREAADRTYLSLTQAPVGDAPFVSRLDSLGRLWLEEYPRYPATASEQVLNGHNYTLFGLHDYWQMTGQRAEVALMIRGGLRTVEDTVMSGFRRTNWASVYSLRHKVPALSYHYVHTDQFLLLWRMTKSPPWVVTADVFRRDFPRKNIPGTAVITPRTRTIHQLDSNYRVIRSRTVSFSRTTGAPFSTRHRIQGGPWALRISAGAYAGWWFPEARGVAWARGATDVHAYGPRVRLTFAGPKLYSAYKLDANGLVVGYKNVTISRPSDAPTARSAIVEGRPAWYMDVGAFAGYWVPLQGAVTVHSYP